MSNTIEWTRSNILLLISLYRKKTILWDPQNSQHYNKLKKQEAWQELADEFQTTSEECKRKMSSLLASFRREKAKMVKSDGTGSNAGKRYKSGWFAFQPLVFVLDRHKPRTAVDPLESDEETEEHVEEEEDIYTPKYEKEKNHEINRSTKPSKFDASHVPRKKLKTSTEEMVASAYKILQKVAQNQEKPETSTKQAIDECESFGLFVSNKLKNYTRSTRNSVQHYISNILFNADQGQYDSVRERVMSKFECEDEQLVYRSNSPNSEAASSPSPQTS